MGVDGVLTDAAIAPLLTVITGNVGVLLPVGITVLGLMIGIALIPKLIYKFF